ncbi:MAG TPA: mannose-1-phosphate guanylyltransferase [Bacteroidales bacterium]
MNNRYVIIMAGGVGSRFWPLSRSKKPKQFLDILGTGETLLQQTFRRFKSVCPEENILVVTNADHKELVIEQLGIKPERVLSEPLRKNTAPCIAYGTFIIKNENPDAVIAVTPADHIITNEDEFRKIINAGFDFAQGNDVLITLGIKPDKPETGYGYIQSEKSDSAEGFNKLLKVKAFTEKPDLETAKSFLKSGDFYWNSGIFIWSSKSIIKAMETFLPDICLAFNGGGAIPGTIKDFAFINKTYSAIRSISIDYGVLEKAGNVYVLGADMGWSDLGTWSSLYDQTHTDFNENAIVRGKAFTHESNGNLISITPGKVVLIEGLKDFIVVDTDDALLIIRKEEEQKIKQYLEEIKSEIKDI